MAQELKEILDGLPASRRKKIGKRAQEIGSLAELRRTVAKTQVDLAAELKVGQDTISRTERRGDMLISTLRRHIEGMGGRLELVARFPHRAPFVIRPRANDLSAQRGKRKKPAKAGHAAP